MSLKRIETGTKTVYINPDQISYARVHEHTTGKFTAILCHENGRTVFASQEFDTHIDAENWIDQTTGVRY